MQTIRNSTGEALDVAYHSAFRESVLIILGHGLTGNKDRPVLRQLAEALAQNGWPCIRVSYAGNGISEGRFTESNISKSMNDLTAVIDQVGLGKRIVYVGHSQGSAVGALTAARDDRISGLVSLAGLAHTKEFVQRVFHGVVPDVGHMWGQSEFPLTQQWLDDLHEIDTILPACRDIKLPWLLFHGLKDDEVFPKDSEDLFKVLRGKKKYISLPHGDHLLEQEAGIIATETCEWLEKHFS
ncbi:MAG: alpha/beta hydrolase family protein [Akkermansiaceae bacterium]